MKYQLKRSKTNLIISCAGLTLFVAGFAIVGLELKDALFPTIIGSAICIVSIIYEIGRIKGDNFFFDENSFSVDGEKFTYSQISHLQVYAVSSRYRHTENIDIFINDEYVFGFNKKYENAGKFLDLAQNHNVKIKIGISKE